MPLYKKKRTINVILEVVKGTYLAATNAIRVYDLDIKPTRPFEKRPGTGLTIGNHNPGSHGEDSGECSFKFKVRGNGSAGLDTAQAIVVQACSLKKTTEVYQSTSNYADQKTITIDTNMDGKKESLYGAMGEIKFTGKVGDDLIGEATFIGKYAVVEDEALAAYAPGTQTPMKVQGGAFTLGAVAMLIANYEMAMNNAVSLRPDASDTTAILTAAIPSNDPQVSVDPEDDLVANYDFDGIEKAGTLAAISLQATDGTDTITIATGAVQTIEKTPSDRDNIATLDWSGQCLNTDPANDDAVVITVAAI